MMLGVPMASWLSVKLSVKLWDITNVIHLAVREDGDSQSRIVSRQHVGALIVDWMTPK